MTRPRRAEEILESLTKTLQYDGRLDVSDGSVIKAVLGAVCLELEKTEAWIGRLINDYKTHSIDPQKLLTEEGLKILADGLGFDVTPRMPTREPAEAPWGTTEDEQKK
jgi:hypothetical protein